MYKFFKFSSYFPLVSSFLINYDRHLDCLKEKEYEDKYFNDNIVLIIFNEL